MIEYDLFESVCHFLGASLLSQITDFNPDTVVCYTINRFSHGLNAFGFFSHSS